MISNKTVFNVNSKQIVSRNKKNMNEKKNDYSY